MTYQDSKAGKEQFKEEFKGRIKRFILSLIQFIDSLPNDRTCRIVTDQLLRSGTSIGANYFEARAASSKNDFINYFTHSLKSANESKFWLELLMETGKCDIQQAQTRQHLGLQHLDVEGEKMTSAFLNFGMSF